MAQSHAKIFGLVPYDLKFPSPGRVRRRFWNSGDERFLAPTYFGIGWTTNLRSAHRHPVPALLVAAFVLWRIRGARRR